MEAKKGNYSAHDEPNRNSGNEIHNKSNEKHNRNHHHHIRPSRRTKAKAKK